MRILNFRQSQDLVVLIDPNGRFASNPIYMDWTINSITGPIKTISEEGWRIITENLELDALHYDLIWTWDTELEELEIDDPS